MGLLDNTCSLEGIRILVLLILHPVHAKVEVHLQYFQPSHINLDTTHFTDEYLILTPLMVPLSCHPGSVPSSVSHLALVYS